MSYYALFGSVVQRLRRATWGTQIPVDGQPHDTAVDPAMQEIADMLSDVGPIDLAGTVKVKNSGPGPAFEINSTNGNGGFNVQDASGRSASFEGYNGITTEIPFVGAFLDPSHPDKTPISVTVNECGVTVKYKRKVLTVANGFVTLLTGDPDT